MVAQGRNRAQIGIDTKEKFMDDITEILKEGFRYCLIQGMKLYQGALPFSNLLALVSTRCLQPGF